MIVVLMSTLFKRKKRETNHGKGISIIRMELLDSCHKNMLHNMNPTAQQDDITENVSKN